MLHPFIRVPIECFSSLYIGILAATECQEDRKGQCQSFSSLYIGILAATGMPIDDIIFADTVSVPFTSGSSLQLLDAVGIGLLNSFSSLYIGILAAT